MNICKIPKPYWFLGVILTTQIHLDMSKPTALFTTGNSTMTTTMTTMMTTITSTTTTAASTLSESQLITALAFPIVVYVLGRMSERSFRALYLHLRGDLQFRGLAIGDSASLVMTTRNPIYLDEVQIHLTNKVVDVIELLKKKMNFQPHQRVQMSPLDRLEFECVIQQPAGDKSLFIHAFLGTMSETVEETLTTEAKSAADFMRETDLTIIASSKTCRRKLL